MVKKVTEKIPGKFIIASLHASSPAHHLTALPVTATACPPQGHAQPGDVPW